MYRRKVRVLHVKGLSRGGPRSSVEKTWHIKVLELEAVRLAIFSFTKFKKQKSVHLRIDNIAALSLSLLFIKHGRNPEQTFNQNLERILEKSWAIKHPKRLGIPKLPGQQRMETLPNCFQKNLQSFREAIIGPVCFQTLLPTATIHSLATRPSNYSNRCISTGLEIPINAYFSTILNDRKSVKESLKRPDQQDHCYSCWKLFIKNPFLIPNHPKVLLSPEGKTHPLIQNLSLRLVALLVSSSLSSKGISKRAIDLISNAQRTGSQSNYKSAWRNWVGWCHRKQTDPLVTI